MTQAKITRRITVKAGAEVTGSLVCVDALRVDWTTRNKLELATDGRMERDP